MGVRKDAAAEGSNKSSYEFLAALIVAILIPLFPSWVALLADWAVCACAAVYFCHLYGKSAGYASWKKVLSSLLLVVLLASFMAPQIVSRYRDENVIPPAIPYLTQWGRGGTRGAGPALVGGSPPRVVSGEGAAGVTVDGSLLMKYKDRFSLMIVLFHVMNEEDYMEKTDLCKSNLARIRPENMPISADYNQLFLNEVALGAKEISFVLLAVPNGKRPNDFKTLNDAEDKGFQIIGKVSSSLGVTLVPAPAAEVKYSSH